MRFAEFFAIVARRHWRRSYGANMPERTWPPYRVGNADYIHALGVVASVFNLLEFRFRSFFHLYTRIPTPPAYNYLQI
jgi:hypothetical protein